MLGAVRVRADCDGSIASLTPPTVPCPAGSRLSDRDYYVPGDPAEPAGVELDGYGTRLNAKLQPLVNTAGEVVGVNGNGSRITNFLKTHDHAHCPALRHHVNSRRLNADPSKPAEPSRCASVTHGATNNWYIDMLTNNGDTMSCHRLAVAGLALGSAIAVAAPTAAFADSSDGGGVSRASAEEIIVRSAPIAIQPSYVAQPETLPCPTGTKLSDEIYYPEARGAFTPGVEIENPSRFLMGRIAPLLDEAGNRTGVDKVGSVLGNYDALYTHTIRLVLHCVVK